MNSLINVLFSASKNVVIDEFKSNGRSHYSNETLEQVRLRYPDAEVMDINTAIATMEAKLKTQPKEISEADFEDGLGQMPPSKFIRTPEGTSFMFQEHLSGMITSIYASIRGRYFCFNDLCTLSHNEIISKIKLHYQGEFA